MRKYLYSFLVISVFAIGFASSDEETNSESEKPATEQKRPVPKTKSVVVNGKSIQVSEGITTKNYIVNILGEPDFDGETYMRYSWIENDRGKHVFFYFNEDSTLSRVSTASEKLNY